MKCEKFFAICELRRGRERERECSRQRKKKKANFDLHFMDRYKFHRYPLSKNTDSSLIYLLQNFNTSEKTNIIKELITSKLFDFK